MKSRSAAVLALVLLLAVLPVPTIYAEAVGNDVTYTTDADFDLGTLVSVNHDPPNNDQLQLDQPTVPFPFINVAASGRGTVVRIGTDTGQIIGEYPTAPEGYGTDPSRTTVDLFGNVWTGSRAEAGEIDGVPHGSVVKIGLVVGGERVDADGVANPNGDYLAPPYAYNTCVDRNNDGLIATSRGLGDVRPWPDETDGMGGADGIVEDAEDECILVYQRTPDAEEVRHLSVDASNNVWVGGYPFGVLPFQRSFHLLDGDTGAILDSIDTRTVNAEVGGCGGYGGLVDGDGILWSVSRGPSHAEGLVGYLLRYDPAQRTGVCIELADAYGMGIDTNGYIWSSVYPEGAIAKVSPAGAIQSGFPRSTIDGDAGSKGVAVTPLDNHVWIANSHQTTVTRLDNDGAIVKVIEVGCGPHGVAVDAAGKVWATNICGDDTVRIDPSGGDDGNGEVDLRVDLGEGAGPYNYSDMTGAVVVGQTSPQGIWTVTQDSGAAGFEWGRLVWNTEPEGHEPDGTAIVVEVRTSDTEAGLAGAAFAMVGNGELFSSYGRFIEVRVTLRASRDGLSPILSDIRVQPAMIEVAADIKPGSCPNPFNPGARGTTPVAILGTDDFDVRLIDPSSVMLEGVVPLRWAYDDVATPFEPYIGRSDPLDCNADGPDGYTDLTLAFETQTLAAALDDVGRGDVRALNLTGSTFDGVPILAEDVIVIARTSSG